jgi:hypothetical protein
MDRAEITPWQRQAVLIRKRQLEPIRFLIRPVKSINSSG